MKFKIDGLGFTVIPKKPIGPMSPKAVSIDNLHYHTMYELFYADDDPITVYTIENTFHYTNCIVCIPPFFKHLTIRKPGLRILFTYDKTHPESPGIAQFMNLFFSSTAPFRIVCDKKMRFLFNEIDCSFEVNNRLSDEVIKSLLVLIFTKIYDKHSLLEKDNHTPLNESYLIKIDDIINDFQADVTLQYLADALHLSTKQTTRILKKKLQQKAFGNYDRKAVVSCNRTFAKKR